MKSLGHLVVAATLVLPLHAYAQHRADFSGKWVIDPARSVSSISSSDLPVKHLTVEIVQSERDLRIDTTRDAMHQSVKYTVGQDITAGEPRPVGTSGTSSATILQWDDSVLVTSTPVRISDTPVTVIERRRLSADGREMTVETRVDVQHGYQGQGLNSSVPITDVYVRETK